MQVGLFLVKGYRFIQSIYDILVTEPFSRGAVINDYLLTKSGSYPKGEGFGFKGALRVVEKAMRFCLLQWEALEL